MTFKKLIRTGRQLFATEFPLTYRPNGSVAKYIELHPQHFVDGKHPEMKYTGRSAHPHGSTMFVVYNPALNIAPRVIECHKDTLLFTDIPDLKIPQGLKFKDLIWVCRIYEFSSEVL
jgi:hypothetical protein